MARLLRTPSARRGLGCAQQRQQHQQHQLQRQRHQQRHKPRHGAIPTTLQRRHWTRCCCVTTSSGGGQQDADIGLLLLLQVWLPPVPAAGMLGQQQRSRDGPVQEGDVQGPAGWQLCVCGWGGRAQRSKCWLAVKGCVMRSR